MTKQMKVYLKKQSVLEWENNVISLVHLLLCIATLIISLLRLGGITHAVFNAIAHLFIGSLFGAILMHFHWGHCILFIIASATEVYTVLRKLRVW